MKRIAGSLVVCGSWLVLASVFLPWVDARTALLPPEDPNLSQPNELTLQVSPLQRAIGLKAVDTSDWLEHFSSKGTVHATHSGESAPLYWLFFLMPLIILVTGFSALVSRSDEWIRLARLTWVVSAIGAALTVKRGIRDHLELTIQTDLGIQTSIVYDSTMWPWLSLVGYLLTMVAASWFWFVWKRKQKASQAKSE